MPAPPGKMEPAAPEPKTVEPEATVFASGERLLGTMAKFVVPGFRSVKLVLTELPVNGLPRFFWKEPSKPISEALFLVTSRNTTLISTWGLGRSRFERTSEMYLVVSGSATT